ncbi:hypothetical protein GOEFS_060_00410 [Gordonia effusa NBRC 100432]|uniref:Phosphatidic acid phosphatase type 2/haloperoxidase domain-containing protein n=1 Tax=Gordonia effusa NBRC 100432 TaxID=1077974 RepID=H0R0P7_9ACTN|nr:phosphatase PAP2 family protein [Gordonia effusa]GAB18648.1 hypothetical protein GOEFS_060_00410 [Gordonia effusa NBRC 100432]
MTVTRAVPHTRATTRAVLVTVAFVIAAAGVFVAAVWTSPGQAVDQWFYNVCRGLAPTGEIPLVARYSVIASPLIWAGVAVAAILLAATRRFSGSWSIRQAVMSIGPLLVFLPVMAYGAGFLRDHVLPRPHLHDWISQMSNSAPSGHAAAAAAFVVVLVRAAPPILRLPLAVAGGTWAAVADFGLVADGWHRPSDVIISTLLVVGIGAVLPDPWRGHDSRSAAWLAWPAGAVIVVGAVVFATSYYPAPAQLITATTIAVVIAAALVVADLVSRTPAGQVRPNTIDSVTSSNRWSIASR